MKERYRLAGLGNHELLTRLSELVQRENELTAELLAHLAEVQERRLHVKLGFSSLFAYCTEALGFSESAAGRRIAAARLCQRFPQVFELIACGELHLSALSALGPCVNDANATELFDACRRKSRRRVDEILAARFPKPDLPEQIRRLPAPRMVQEQLPAAPTCRTAEVPGPSVAVSVASPTLVPHETPTSSPANPVPVSRPSRQKAIEPLSSERFGVRLTIDAEARDVLEQARALASRRLPNGDMASLFKLAMRSLVRELEKERFGIGRRPRIRRANAQAGKHESESADTPTPSDSPPPGGSAEGKHRRSRRVAADVMRELYARDQCRCTFVSEDGKRCEARHFLEIDHVKPWARSGASTIDNLRLRCRAHNQLHAQRQFGRAYVDAAIARARRDRKLVEDRSVVELEDSRRNIA